MQTGPWIACVGLKQSGHFLNLPPSGHSQDYRFNQDTLSRHSQDHRFHSQDCRPNQDTFIPLQHTPRTIRTLSSHFHPPTGHSQDYRSNQDAFLPLQNTLRTIDPKDTTSSPSLLTTGHCSQAPGSPVMGIDCCGGMGGGYPMREMFPPGGPIEGCGTWPE